MPPRGGRRIALPAFGGHACKHGLHVLAAVLLVPLAGRSGGVLAIFAVLLLLLLIVLRRGSRLLRRGGALEFPHARFELVHEANVLVILHHASFGCVVHAAES